MSLQDNIKRKRLEKGFTLEELAREVGVSRQTIQRYESGVISNIPSDKIEKIARALNTSPGFLMGWDEKTFRLKTLRKEHGLTKKQLASEINMTEQDIEKLDNGDLSVLKTKQQLTTLADTLGVHVVYILGIDSPGGELLMDEAYLDMLIRNVLHLDSQDDGTIAAHFDGSEFTPEELEEIKQFAEFIKNRRK